MADQSSVQSLLQQLAGTASAGQANLPSNVNNGNPNTIYNQPLKSGGYLPPVTNAFDQWRINPAPQAPQGAIDWQQLAAHAPGNNLASFLPKWPTVAPAVNIPGWGGTPNPPIPPPVTPPGGVNTGGNLPPSTPGAGGGGPGVQPVVHGGGPGLQDPNAGHYADFTGGLDHYNFDAMNFQDLMSGGQGGLGATTPVSPAALTGGTTVGSNFLNGLLNVVESKTGTTGGVSWQQAVDALVLPGNAYLSASKKWDLSNLLAGLAQKFTGLPINAIMNSVGQYLTKNPSKMSWLPSWLRNIFTSHYQDNAANAAAARQNLANQSRNHGGGIGIGQGPSILPGGGSPFGNNGTVGSYYVWDNTGTPLTYNEYNTLVRGTALDRGWSGTDGRGGGGGGAGAGYGGGFSNMDAGGAFGGMSGGSSRGTGWATGTNGAGSGSGSLAGLPIDQE